MISDFFVVTWSQFDVSRQMVHWYTIRDNFSSLWVRACSKISAKPLADEYTYRMIKQLFSTISSPCQVKNYPLPVFVSTSRNQWRIFSSFQKKLYLKSNSNQIPFIAQSFFPGNNIDDAKKWTCIVNKAELLFFCSKFTEIYTWHLHLFFPSGSALHEWCPVARCRWTRPGHSSKTPQHLPTETDINACFQSLARSKLSLCSANHRAGYLSNLACDWLSLLRARDRKWAQDTHSFVTYCILPGHIDRIGQNII